MIKLRVIRLLKKGYSLIVLQVKRCFFEEVLVLGDSHAAVFFNSDFRSSFPRHFFNVICVGGATVSGLTNPNSVTQALPIFKKSIKKFKGNKVIVLLGEVDTGFVIWYRAERDNTPVEEALNKAINNYQKFILEISEKHQVICISTPLPTIQDNNEWGEVANLRKNIQATQFERTKLTLKFNRKMEKISSENNFHYLSLDDESLGEDGIVHPKLLNENRNDHHYKSISYADMLVAKLKQVI